MTDRHRYDPEQRELAQLRREYHQLRWEFERHRRHAGREFARLRREIAELRDRPHAVESILHLGGSPVPGAINVDTTNETATLSFLDDHGNSTDAPDGAQIEFTSDNEAVATVQADGSNPLQADITPVGIGEAHIVATSNGTAVNAAGEQIADPDPVTVTVSAGPADSEGFVLSV